MQKKNVFSHHDFFSLMVIIPFLELLNSIIFSQYYTHNMSKRVTIMIDDDMDAKLRIRQARLIEKDKKSISYSRVLNDTLRKTLKN